MRRVHFKALCTTGYLGCWLCCLKVAFASALNKGLPFPASELIFTPTTTGIIVLYQLRQDKPSPCLLLTMSEDAVAKDGEVDPLDTIEESEYPGPLRLTAIIVALVLSIFLASLDTVRQNQVEYSLSSVLNTARPS